MQRRWRWVGRSVMGACVLLVLAGTPLRSQTAAPADAPTYGALARDSYADLPGVRVFYVDTGGTGIPVVLLHAGTGSARVWEYQLPAFIKAGYRVIATDRRGYGRTVVTEGGPVATAPDDLEELMKHLKIDRFHLVGTAAGGMVAIDYALSYQGRLRSLVVANSVIGVVDEDYAAIGRFIRPRLFSDLPPDFRELSPSYRAANPDGTKKWLSLERIRLSPGPRPPSQPPKNRVTFKLLETIHAPSLFLTGEADLYSPPPTVKMAADRVPGAQFVKVREVGHSTHWEQPDVFNATVIGFIQKH